MFRLFEIFISLGKGCIAITFPPGTALLHPTDFWIIVFIFMSPGVFFFLISSLISALIHWLVVCSQSFSSIWLCDPVNQISCPPVFSVHGIFSGKNTGVACHCLLQGIFLIQGLNPCLLSLLHWQADSLPLHHMGSPNGYVVAYYLASVCLWFSTFFFPCSWFLVLYCCWKRCLI